MMKIKTFFDNAEKKSHHYHHHNKSKRIFSNQKKVMRSITCAIHMCMCVCVIDRRHNKKKSSLD